MLHQIAPSTVTGYPLNPVREWIGIIVPEETTNLLPNPSFETDDPDAEWTTSADTGPDPGIIETGVAVFSGNIACRLVHTAGTTWNQIVCKVALTIGTTYTFSMHLKRADAVPITKSNTKAFFNNGEQELTGIQYVAGGWYRVWYTGKATATNAPGLRFYEYTSGTDLYLDAAQLEAKPYPTTYCDGDQLGLVEQSPSAYRWLGRPHASASVRDASTGAGGRVVPLESYNAVLFGTQGLGATNLDAATQEYALLDGSAYSRSRRTSRSFSLAMRISASSTSALSRARSALRQDLAHDRTAVDQPVRFVFQMFRDADPIGDLVTLDARYVGGLEETRQSLYDEQVNVSFVADTPHFRRADVVSVKTSGVAPGATTIVFSDGFVGLRTSQTAAWQFWDANAAATCVVNHTDGYLYAAGLFTDIDGVAANRIARWDGSTWSALSTGMDSGVTDMLSLPTGELLVVGSFTTAGGSAANGTALWNGTSWVQYDQFITPGHTGSGVTIGPDGLIYLATSGGVYTRERYSGGWSLMAGSPTQADSVTVGLDNQVYVGKSGTTGAEGVYRWDGSVWTNIGATTGGNYHYSLDTLPDGRILAGGRWTTIAGLSISDIAVWNGTGWAAYAEGDLGEVRDAAIDVYGNVWLGINSNRMSAATRKLHAGGFVQVVGGNRIMPIDMAALDTPATPVLVDHATGYGVHITDTRIAVCGLADAGAVYLTSKEAETIEYPGTVPSAPTWLIISTTNTGVTVQILYLLANDTHGGVVTFNNLALLEDEYLFVDLRRGIRASSTTRDATSYVNPASRLDMMKLRPGTNVISTLTPAGLGDIYIAADILYSSLDDSVRSD